jgi:hypothetical protein
MGLSGVVLGVVGNQIIIAGGNNFPEGLPWEGGVKKYYDHVFVYDLKGDTVIIADSSVRLPSKVAYAAVAQLKEGIFYAGGENEKGPLNSAYLIKKGKQQTFEIIELPHLPIAITNAVAEATDNALYVLGGANKEGVSNKVWKLALNNIKKGWTGPGVQINHAIDYDSIIKLKNKYLNDSYSILYEDNTAFIFNDVHDKYPITYIMNLATPANNLVQKNLSDKKYLFIGRCAYINEINKLDPNLKISNLELVSVRGIGDPVCATSISK